MTTQLPATNSQPTTADRPRNKGGAKPGNANAVIHGGRSKRPRLWRGIGHLRPDLQPIETDVARLHSQLTGKVVEVRQAVSIADASAIDTACGWEFHLQLCLKYLAAGDLKPAQEIEFSLAAAEAREKRHKRIAELDLTEKAADVWGFLTALPVALPALAAQTTPADGSVVLAADAAKGQPVALDGGG